MAGFCGRNNASKIILEYMGSQGGRIRTALVRLLPTAILAAELVNFSANELFATGKSLNGHVTATRAGGEESAQLHQQVRLAIRFREHIRAFLRRAVRRGIAGCV